jgi:threonyl-tRNA synthetase
VSDKDAMLVSARGLTFLSREKKTSGRFKKKAHCAIFILFSSKNFHIETIKITINTSEEEKEAKRRREEAREERFRALVEENDFAMVSERARTVFFFLSLLSFAIIAA